MTYPSEEKNLLGNIPKRELWCPYCKKVVVSDAANPKCDDYYKTPLITIVKSTLDGTRITGKDELGSRRS